MCIYIFIYVYINRYYLYGISYAASAGVASSSVSVSINLVKVFSCYYVTLTAVYGYDLHLRLRYVTLNCRNFIVSVVAAVVRSDTSIHTPRPSSLSSSLNAEIVFT